MGASPWTLAATPAQTGRVALVTGANTGLGYATARGLALTGATVLLACRHEAKGAAAARALQQEVPGATVELVRLDLADLSDVAAAAADVMSRYDRLDLLVNNAGLMATDRGYTVDGFETQFGVNHLGHFALTMDLLPRLMTTPGARVVTVSSIVHRIGRLRLDDPHADQRRYRRWPAYSASKLANVLFATELQRRLGAVGADTLSLVAHPGVVNTDIGREGKGALNRLMFLLPVVAQSPATGALASLRAALDPLAAGGQLYGPRWMLWGKPVLEAPARRTRRTADAAALWDLSERLTGRAMPERPVQT